MSLRTTLRTTMGLSAESELEQGSVDEVRERKQRRIQEERVRVARENSDWIEVDESVLVRRPPRYLVDAQSDAAFTICRGEIWAGGSASVAFVDPRREMWFFVRDDNEIVFLERDRRTWSEIFAKRVRRGTA